MFLKSLNISSRAGEIRHIKFQKGVNLIVDNSKNPKESGNNVGKTTILRLVDFCLAGDGKNIYTDPEFGTVSEVKNFLIEQEVLITLVLVDNLESPAPQKVTIERNFLPRKYKIQRINDEPYNNDQFKHELARLLFAQSNEKPTIRQLVAKNIRDEKAKLSNILKVLHTSTTGVQYETLYQFWLGVSSSDGADYQRAKEAHTAQEKYKKKLAKQFDVNGFQVLPEVASSVEALKEQKARLDLTEDYQKQLEAFDALKSEMGHTATQLSVVSLRKDLIEESRKNLESDISKVSIDEIEALYREAKLLIPNLQKSFDESVRFHNQMIQNKLGFITKELPELAKQERELIQKLNALESDAEAFKSLLHKDKTLEALDKINEELQVLIERQAKLSEQKRIWDKCTEELGKLEDELAEYSDQAKQLNSTIDKHLELFNTKLKRISKELYEQQYLLTRATVDAKGEELPYLQFEMQGVTSNPGTGEKKGHITAFDLAYIEFAEQLNIPHLNFIMHDQIENVDDRQIVTILARLVPSINCQYIAPILQDKIPDGINIERDAIIELSQEEKLFKF
ncbi:DUF2326 domain-containing protein [Verrucomicrobiaceae bacterium 227]